jgi:bacteriorhodopsin
MNYAYLLLAALVVMLSMLALWARSVSGAPPIAQLAFLLQCAFVAGGWIACFIIWLVASINANKML